MDIGIVSVTESDIVCEIDTVFQSNGHDVKKTVTFSNEGYWKLDIAKTNVDLSSLKVKNTYICSKDGINLVIDIVRKINLCEGITMNKSVLCSRYHTLERWTNETSDNKVRKIRSIKCLKVVHFLAGSHACRMCMNMTIGQRQSKDQKENKEPNEKIWTAEKPSAKNVTIKDFKKLIPNASQEMLELLISQAKNSEKDPRGRRWTKGIISTCLNLYNRSPLGYAALRSSQMLLLPSPSTLILYKNSVKQKPGFQKEIFYWMYEEAKRLEIPTEGLIGGVIVDEISIQEDLQILKNGDAVELAGFTDLGKEANTNFTLRTGKFEKCLANHVVQFVFVGLTGFRFPFAYFLSRQIQAAELHSLFWEAVFNLQMAGFTVAFTCMDGASSNRSFLHINIGSESCLDKSMTVINPCDVFSGSVTFMMDYSHCVKKLRNNIMKSGIQKECTRLVTLPSGETVQWQMFVDCYKWDVQNALQIHRRLTNEHLFPSNQSKMRNHLAEEVLNADMLNLFETYQAALGGKGSVLNGVIQLLKQTSTMITIFRDHRPIRSVDDERLVQLQHILSWFLELKHNVESNNTLTKKEKEKSLLSYQCMEDVASCIRGFLELCEKCLTDDSHQVFITPSIINSDVVENIFNQQRSTYHGANANPNSVQYSSGLNSIIIGQTVISKKANAGKVDSKLCAQSFAFRAPWPLRKRKRVVHDLDKYKKLKIIRC